MLSYFNLKFTCQYRFVFMTFAVTGLFIFLGFWQLERANEKRQMLALEKRLVAQKPVAITPMTKVVQYQPITVSGHFLPITLLLDNQHVDHQFGFNVLTPFVTKSGKVLLVDRGWVKGDITRKIFPTIETPTSTKALIGVAYYPSKGGLLLGQASEKIDDSRYVIEQINQKLAQNILQKKVYPFIMRMNSKMADGFHRQWPIVSMSPSRHVGYAFQWFAMAIAVMVIFLSLTIRKR